jgi:hypothetical protein
MAIIDAIGDEGYPEETPDQIQKKIEEPTGVILPEGSKFYPNTDKETDKWEEAVVKAKEKEKLEPGMHQPIELIPERPPYRQGDNIMYTDLMGRIETLENRFNKLIDAVSKSKKVKDI